MSLNYLATRYTCSWPWQIGVLLCDGRMRAAHVNGARIQAQVNGQAVAGCTLAPASWTNCRLDLPEAALRLGINELVLTSDSLAAPADHPGDTRELAFVLQPSRIR